MGAIIVVVAVFAGLVTTGAADGEIDGVVTLVPALVVVSLAGAEALA